MYSNLSPGPMAPIQDNLTTADGGIVEHVSTPPPTVQGPQSGGSSVYGPGSPFGMGAQTIFGTGENLRSLLPPPIGMSPQPLVPPVNTNVFLLGPPKEGLTPPPPIAPPAIPPAVQAASPGGVPVTQTGPGAYTYTPPGLGTGVTYYYYNGMWNTKPG